MSQILANLVIGANGATTIAGRSRGLSFPADRERFWQLRNRANSIVIGGATYRSEPYQSTQLPLFVATRTMKRGSKNFLNLPPAQVVTHALENAGPVVLVEGGVGFLSPLIEEAVITHLYLTRSEKSGTSHFFNEQILDSKYRCTSDEKHDGGTLQIWEPFNQSR